MYDDHVDYKFLTIDNEGVREYQYDINGTYNDRYDDEDNDIYYNGEISTYRDGRLVEKIEFGCSLDTFNLDHDDDAKYIPHNYDKLLNYELYSIKIVDYNLGTSKYVEYHTHTD